MTESPIFIFSASWRCGSTLVQRLVSTIPGSLIWGEPFEELAWPQALTTSMEGLREVSRFGLDGSSIGSEFRSSLHMQSIQTLRPNAESLRDAHRAFVTTLLRKPALSPRITGVWGAKFVRQPASTMHYLRGLFPDAKMVFVVRDPQAACKSFLRMIGGDAKGLPDWTIRWSESPVTEVSRFYRLWAQNARSFHESIIQGADVHLVRYEDLVSESTATTAETLNGLETYLGRELPAGRVDEAFEVNNAAPDVDLPHTAHWPGNSIEVNMDLRAAAALFSYSFPS